MLNVFILRFKLDAFSFLRLPQNNVYLTPLQDKADTAVYEEVFRRRNTLSSLFWF